MHLTSEELEMVDSEQWTTEMIKRVVVKNQFQETLTSIVPGGRSKP